MKMIKPIIALLFVLSSLSVSAQRFGVTEQDSIECIRNLSLYQEFWRQHDHESAFAPWLQVYRVCPGNHINTFIRGTTLLRGRIARERDNVKRDEYIDLLLELWDTRSIYFGNEGVNLSRKAMDLMTFRPHQVKEAYEMMRRAVMELGVGNDHIAPFFFFEYAMLNERAGNIEKEEVFDIYDIVSTHLERILRERPGDTIIMNTLANLDIAFEPYATCDEIIPIFERRWEENKDDIEFLEKVTRVLDHKDCNEHDLFFNATQALHALRPTPRSAYLMAKMLDGRQDWNGVVEYLRDNADLLDNDRDRVRAFLLLARAHMQSQRFREGRAAALRALEINPNEGMAHFLIGMMYAQSSRICGGEGDGGVSRRAAYWAAVDRLVRARELSPNLRQINEMISAYRQQFPSREDLFFEGLREGSSFRIGCWIQENTTVRGR